MDLSVTAEGMVKALKHKGLNAFERDDKLFNLNIVGIRAKDPVTNKFNCLMTVFWKYEGRWNLMQFQATTLAGLSALKKPINPKGCAILKPGRYSGVYKLDMHGGKYEALCQRLGNVTVFRDDDKDREYDMIAGSEQTGMFGINIHRASANKELEDIGPYSAGCQVIQDPIEFDMLICLCKKAAEIWGNKFTYTLIEENDYISANA